MTNFRRAGDFSGGAAIRDPLTGLLNRKTFDESFLKASVEAGGVLLEGQADGRRAHSHGERGFFFGSNATDLNPGPYWEHNRAVGGYYVR